MPESSRPAWLQDAERVDIAVYAAIATTSTPTLDRAMAAFARSTDHSRLWIGASAMLAIGRGRRGRRAAGMGLGAIAVTSAVVNAAGKPLARRRRPDRAAQSVPVARHVRMPTSHSLPSGHAASAMAFATAVGHVLPREAAVLRAVGALVAYSRVHTGVHFPGDVVLGSLLGTTLAQATTHAAERRWPTR